MSLPFQPCSLFFCKATVGTAACCWSRAAESFLSAQQLPTRPPPQLPHRAGRSVIRRSTTLLVVSGEFWLFKKRPSQRSLAALLLMVCGAVVAGLTDLTFNLPG